jgi:hypothetical protein
MQAVNIRHTHNKRLIVFFIVNSSFTYSSIIKQFSSESKIFFKGCAGGSAKAPEVLSVSASRSRAELRSAAEPQPTKNIKLSLDIRQNLSYNRYSTKKGEQL